MMMMTMIVSIIINHHDDVVTHFFFLFLFACEFSCIRNFKIFHFVFLQNSNCVEWISIYSVYQRISRNHCLSKKNDMQNMNIPSNNVGIQRMKLIINKTKKKNLLLLSFQNGMIRESGNIYYKTKHSTIVFISRIGHKIL